MKLSTSGMDQQTHEGEKCLNSELWHACAGPLVSLPTVGSRVVYSPQGHSEQVAATTNKEVDAHIPNYPSLSPQMICQLHNVTMHADVETDEVYAQMTLQPLTQEEQKDVYLPVELGVPSMQPTNYFCKTLTASDTSTHGGFSVPRRAAEKVFPPLDFSQTPPVQELVARDLHDVEWKFRHIFRGQPKRHLLTTGWSVFVSAKRLVAGDSVLFIWNQKNQLFLGIRRAIRPQTVMPSSVLSSDSMHIGLLAAAAHAAATNSCFTVFFNPRASPSEFVIPLSKYVKAVCHTRVSVGMRFRMLFETEESTVRRYMGTITGIGDLDPVRWPKSHWRSVKVGWDESTASERQPTVSLWDIEPLTTFPMYASLFPPRLKRPWYPGASSFQIQDGSNEAVAYFRGEAGEQGLNPTNMLSPGMLPWMQQRFDPSLLRNDLSQQYQAMLAFGLQNQFMQLQQPVQVPTQTQMLSSNIESPLQQQIQNRTEELQQQQQIIYQEPFLNNHLQPRESDFLSASNSKFPSSMAHSTLKNLIGSFNNEGSSDLLNFSRTGQPLLNEQSSHQTWMAKFAQSPINNALGEQSLDLQNHTLFGANVGSSDFLLPTTVSRTVTSLVHADILSMPLGYQSAPYGFTQDSSELLHGTEQVDPPTPTEIFVKVSKAGSVGRSLDIARFSSYRELRQELGQMFGIQGLLEVDPQRSGWQLVFVDRENDVLLLGDDPWAEFMNNVWYIKILSPEDVQNLGKQESLSRSENAVRMMNSSTDTQNLVSGFSSLGSLEY